MATKPVKTTKSTEAAKSVKTAKSAPPAKSAKAAHPEIVPIEKEEKNTGTPYRDRFLAPFEDMERWVDDALTRRFLSLPRFNLSDLRMPWSGEISPQVDIYEEGDEVVVKAELPGMKKADIEVSISDDIITISGEKKAEEKVEKKNYFRVERSYGSFTRKMRLPAAIVSDKAKATFAEGVLEVRIPKTVEAKTKQKKVPVE